MKMSSKKEEKDLIEDKKGPNEGDCVSVATVATNAVDAVKNNETVKSAASVIVNLAVAKATVSIIKRVFSDIGDILTGGLLKTQSPPFVYGSPLAGDDSLSSKIMALAVAERSLIFSESFEVQDHTEPYCLVKGGKLHIITKPKLYVYHKDVWVATLVKQENEDSTNYYDVLRGETDEKIGEIQKTMKPNGKDFFFEFHAESDISDRKWAYHLDGDFLSRRFVMKNTKCETVAKVTKQLIAFAAFDHYMIRIASGMDPILVICCMVVIDEELDDLLKERIKCVMEKAAETAGYDISMANPFW
jgi:uncharacterized protein YxjI